MREIVFDTETTGLDPADGHRVVEIGALELINHMPTGATFHEYINPRRSMPAEAFAIHGISDGDLAGKPYFEDIAAAFIAFIGDACLVAHNASFDIKFLNFELLRAGQRDLSANKTIDTLEVARKKFPGAQNSLDGLSRRFGVDTSQRVKHGALLDSEILADVYLELLGGRQSALLLDSGSRKPGSAQIGGVTTPIAARQRPAPRPSLLTDEERAAHAAFVETLGDATLWRATSES